MKKMQTLFVREFDKHRITIKREIIKGCEWVMSEGIATRKYDGTCCLIKNGAIYKRFDYKEGRILPSGAIPCQEKADETTGHFPHWVKCEATNSADKWHIKALEGQHGLVDGTYELCGQHFQSNIDRLVEGGDILVRHGADVLDIDRSFDGIKEYLTVNEIEGIVFHRDNGDMCKIKRSDFGLKWGNSKRR